LGNYRRTQKSLVAAMPVLRLKCFGGENMPTLYTIGYEGATVEQLVQTLKNLGVQMLADVRELPLSRKKGLSKNALAERLAEVGIEYRHFRKLGDPKPGRDAAKAGDFLRFETIFMRHFSSNESRAALGDLLQVASSKITCIMCFERCVSHCHRSYIADDAMEAGFQVLNLVPDRAEAYLRNDFKIPRHKSRKSLSAAE
jgi:uncharacterized protein (DUF488 family)